MIFNFFVFHILKLNILIISREMNDRIGKCKYNKFFTQLTQQKCLRHYLVEIFLINKSI